jgi:3-dehydroquinate synthase
MSSNTVTASEYDIVKVDLSDGRDYPIYIGDSFHEEEAGKLLRSHVTGNRAFLITNDLIAPMYLEKYASLLKQDGKIQVGTLIILYMFRLFHVAIIFFLFSF